MKVPYTLIITTSSSGMTGPTEVICESLEISSNGNVSHKEYIASSTNPRKLYQYWLGEKDIEDIYKFLFEDLDIVHWKEDYSVEVCDGWSWEISLYIDGNEMKHIIGTVEFPERGDELIGFIKDTISFDKEPWLIG